MKKIFTFLSIMMVAAFGMAQDHFVQTVGATAFDPATLTIFVGQTVEFQNTGGNHNINGTQATFPSNPESFGNDVGPGWTYQYTFNTAGVYDYHCNPHQNNMIGQITVVEMGTTGLIISGVLDPQPNDGTGSAGFGAKSLELYAIEDIADLSIYGIGAANNGGGTDSIEFTFPAGSLDAGSCILLTDTASLAKFQAFFGFDPDYLVPGGGATAINGDDAIELFMNGQVVDVFGDIDVDGSGTGWDYLDGWAYRVDGTGPDGNTFVESNWTFSGINALESDMFTMNSEFASPFPNCTYTTMGSSELVANNDSENLPMNMASNIDVLANDMTPNGVTTLTVTSVSINGIAVANGTTDITYTPNMDFCGTDEFTYEVCDATTCAEATVTITIDCPVLYPAYDIGTVTADADGNGVGDSLNVNCTLTGVVYGIDLNGGDALSFTIIDDQNEGINVFNFELIDGYVVNEGDEITVQGEIIQFRGLTEIVPITIALNSSGNMLFNATGVTSLGEDTESQLIVMTLMTIVDETQWLGDGSSFNVDITDGTNTFTMRIDDDTDAASMSVPTSPLGITGIGGQFDNDEPYTEGYQILPRYMADIVEMIGGYAVNPELGDKVKSYPNPVNDLLQIDSEVALDQIWITNVIGQRMGEWSEPDAQLSIDVTAFQSGVYFLTVVKADGIWTSSFVKK
ncbi:MAG: plastocyanin [Polaribacter sp.]|jgi:plastocyanin